GQFAQLGGPVDKRRGYQADTFGAEVGERGVVVTGETDHLASACSGPGRQELAGRLSGRGEPRRQGGGPVLADDDLVVAGGDLTLPAPSGRAQRAVCCRRQVATVLPLRVVHNPGALERVVAKLGFGTDWR